MSIAENQTHSLFYLFTEQIMKRCSQKQIYILSVVKDDGFHPGLEATTPKACVFLLLKASLARSVTLSGGTKAKENCSLSKDF